VGSFYKLIIRDGALPSREESMIIAAIVTQHAEEAAFLWLLRSNATRQPHYALKDLAKLDGRVEAHVDGLRVAGEPGWELCKAALGNEEAGEVFAASVMAFESGIESRIQAILEAVAEDPRVEQRLDLRLRMDAVPTSSPSCTATARS
jgi:uncharacterized protein (TIGR02270 family)